MAYEGYKTLKFVADKGVLFVTIDSPPINLLSVDMRDDFRRLHKDVAADDDTRVVVFKSANPDYFIAHFDVTLLAEFPDTAPPRPKEATGFALPYRTMPKVSIAQIEGRARGGGSEFALTMDMRFGVYGKTIISQPEIALGILPGGGGTQRLPRLIGRSRALEMIMGGMDIDAEVAERYGYLNRAFAADEIGPYVEKLAYQIGSYSQEVVTQNKLAVVNAETMSLERGLIEEDYLFGVLACRPEAKQLLNKLIDVGGQTYEAELNFDEILQKLKD